ncbi:hypothetical protein QQY66_47970 [Streptomyces sp. DG2A-72]|uniref:hypothetical protein n=1 Tax=Streptomyces sp. DG2A-72 TaxID=3051386 RepID=UPI00265B81EC|nr:hypothetical protein [Streptomyces sp. DG2A-72]MDO0939075.1 hypothetical protein [Streptomyces sp. DG2A-72]
MTESDAGLPAAVYEADLVVTAVSGGGMLLDVTGGGPAQRWSTAVVDDSFLHRSDTDRALRRMREGGDVLVVDGGLLALGDTGRRVAVTQL